MSASVLRGPGFCGTRLILCTQASGSHGDVRWAKGPQADIGLSWPGQSKADCLGDLFLTSLCKFITTIKRLWITQSDFMTPGYCDIPRLTCIFPPAFCWFISLKTNCNMLVVTDKPHFILLCWFISCPICCLHLCYFVVSNSYLSIETYMHLFWFHL